MAISDKEFKTEQKILSKVQSLLGKTLETPSGIIEPCILFSIGVIKFPVDISYAFSQ